MRLYDLILVLKTSLSEKEREKLLDTVKADLKGFKIKDDHWGQKPLAYKIKREVAGVYHKLELEGDGILSTDMVKKLINNESVLRHLIIRKDK